MVWRVTSHDRKDEPKTAKKKENHQYHGAYKNMRLKIPKNLTM